MLSYPIMCSLICQEPNLYIVSYCEAAGSCYTKRGKIHFQSIVVFSFFCLILSVQTRNPKGIEAYNFLSCVFKQVTEYSNIFVRKVLQVPYS